MADNDDHTFDFDEAEKFLVTTFRDHSRIAGDHGFGYDTRRKAAAAANEALRLAIDLEHLKLEKSVRDVKGQVSRLKTVDKKG